MGHVLLPDSDYQIVKLSKEFYQEYDEKIYKELLYKNNRPYNCILFQTHYDFFICVPYRTEIRHKNAYIFKNSKRSATHRSGLDYTKIVIVENSRLISDEIPTIDNDEFKETRMNIGQIKRESLQYVDCYIEHIRGDKILSKSAFKKKYYFSTLVYFHKELGL